MKICFIRTAGFVTHISSGKKSLFNSLFRIKRLFFLLLRKVGELRFLYFLSNYTLFSSLATLVISWLNFYIVEFYVVFRHTFCIRSTYLIAARSKVIRYSSFRVTIPFGLFLYSGQYLEYFRFLKYTDI